MTDFIAFEATAVDENQENVVVGNVDDEEEEVSDIDSLDSFIDDGSCNITSNRSFYHQLENVDNSIDNILKEEYEKSLVEIENFDDFLNFCESSKKELGEVDEFKESEKRLEKFDETLFPTSDETVNTFPNAVLYAVRFAVTQKIDVCSDDELKEAKEKFFEKIDRDKFELEMDKEKFNQQCLDINEILSKEGYFLRVYELKKKFRELRLKVENSKT